jgi:hypothetical protein
MVYSGALGTLIREKKVKSEISCQIPFKEVVSLFLLIIKDLY